MADLQKDCEPLTFSWTRRDALRTEIADTAVWH